MPTPTCVLIGNFDGVHRGHQALLHVARLEAHNIHGEIAVLTFDPHPTHILSPDRAVLRLLTLERKRELLHHFGADRVVAQPFDIAFSQKTPREFVQEVIAPLHARVLVVGADFRFGNKREGTVETLIELGKECGFRVQAIPLHALDEEIVSSSRVRQALTEGDLEYVTHALGRPFEFAGLVVKGDQRGRTMGFPTANLETQTEALPKRGAYAVRITWEEGKATLHANGMMNIGTRPTIAQAYPTQTIEVHLFDINQDLYGKTLRVHCIERLRDEQRFEHIEALKAQLCRDKEEARRILKDTNAQS